MKNDLIGLGTEVDGWFCYLFTLAFEDVNLVCHVYRLLDFMLEKTEEDSRGIYLERLSKKTSLIEMKYSETLFQIWHYYLLTKYMDKRQRENLLGDYSRKENINPIILCLFVESGVKANSKLLRIIIEQMKNESTGNDWRNKIMFSRWWLPLMKVRMVDSYNYYGFMQSNMFPEIIADLIE